ncbi:hypothetical protein GOQ30_08530 [Flavobacterium sp. TP390]|uniref:DUF6602 domain-containing protein n=1 Tax=Flavobacterium profundi TaxID=1774945 RepID=A0A6I4IHL4_9FLAO|nr:DUF6602 domain-containing protein [Flavobacterium profundi]MVO09203.1 hypothetical protein [Flavobacterium profundi]
MSENEKINMKSLFIGLQKSMIADLESIRENTPHEPTKGDGSENIWLEFFEKYLPKRYSVTKAIIIDFEGNRSDAIDIVIYDKQYTPFILNRNGIKYLPVESVYAVFEAKQEISKGNLIYAADKVKSVRVLNRTTAAVVDRGEIKTAPKLFNILGGFLSLDNSWADSIETSEPFNNCFQNLKGDEEINIGCVLNDKSFVFDNSKKINFSSDNETLIFFFLKLLLELQKLGTVRPIDLNKYIDQLDSQ